MPEQRIGGAKSKSEGEIQNLNEGDGERTPLLQREGRPFSSSEMEGRRIQEKEYEINACRLLCAVQI